jgi:hypothetical protein
MLDIFHFQNLVAYKSNFAPPPKKKNVNCFKSGKWGTQRNTHTHIVGLLTKFIQIRTNNTKPLYLNCNWISETEPSIKKEHFCEVSNLGDTPLTPVQINSHKYMEQNYGKYYRTSLHFQCTINIKDAYPTKLSTRDSNDMSPRLSLPRFLLSLQPYGTDLFPMSIYCLRHNFCSP